MSIELISLLASIFLAFAGYIITYWNNTQTSRRKEQLDLVNKRIGEFYGPMYIATQSAQKAYEALLKKLGKKKDIFDDKESPTLESDKKEWFLWMKSVFMPNNQLIERLIIEKAYLIKDEKMPECLLGFITHMSGYKANMTKWEQGDYSEILSVIDYPSGLNEYIESAYQELKTQQIYLIGKIKSRKKAG